VMDVADEGAVEKNVAALSRVDHGYISAGIMLNGVIMHNGRSSPWLVPLVSSSSKVYTACRQLDVLRHGSHGQA
jgi:hypothetical protein